MLKNNATCEKEHNYTQIELHQSEKEKIYTPQIKPKLDFCCSLAPVLSDSSPSGKEWVLGGGRGVGVRAPFPTSGCQSRRDLSRVSKLSKHIRDHNKRTLRCNHMCAVKGSPKEKKSRTVHKKKTELSWYNAIT